VIAVGSNDVFGSVADKQSPEATFFGYQFAIISANGLLAKHQLRKLESRRNLCGRNFSNEMITRCKLPLGFDPAPLQEDLAEIDQREWHAHFNTSYFEGEWSGIALRSIGGVASQLYPDPHAQGPVEDTEVLKRCPNLQSVLSAFDCPTRSARLLKLAAGASIKEHRDYNLSIADNELRLHVPIVTNSEVQFFLDAESVEMKEGECWYLDFTLPHWVKNNSSVDRIHLVIDCELNDWLRELLAGASDGQPGENLPASQPALNDFEQFREFVLSQPPIQTRLKQTDDRRSFVQLVKRVGRELGYRFSQEDVEAALQSARKDWLQRWVQ
jgi:hypothetical protein